MGIVCICGQRGVRLNWQVAGDLTCLNISNPFICLFVLSWERRCVSGQVILKYLHLLFLVHVYIYTEKNVNSTVPQENLNGVLKIVKMLCVQRCTLLTLNGHHLGYVPEGGDFQPIFCQLEEVQPSVFDLRDYTNKYIVCTVY